MTVDSGCPDNFSAERKGAQPVIKGRFCGRLVHHVGNKSSSEKRKLISDKSFFRPAFRAPGFGIEFQNRRRNRSTMRMTFPISSFDMATIFFRGNAGAKSMAPASLEACKTASGRVMRTCGATRVDVPCLSRTVTRALPLAQEILLT